MKRLAGIRHYRSESTMEHTEAIETNASDRYALGQLSAAEADAFEEHYFDCADCAEDVRLGMTIMEGGRRLVREAEEPVEAPLAPVVPIDSRPRWGKWIPAAAVAALMAIPINIALLMRMQNAVPVATIAADAVLFSPPARDGAEAEEPVVLVVPNGGDAVVSVDVNTNPAYKEYEAIITRGNKRVATLPIKLSQLQNTLSITLHDPGPGTYDLVIIGREPEGQSADIARHRFIVKR
jgi:anti-sigma factor RsiW